MIMEALCIFIHSIDVYYDCSFLSSKSFKIAQEKVKASINLIKWHPFRGTKLNGQTGKKNTIYGHQIMYL